MDEEIKITKEELIKSLMSLMEARKEIMNLRIHSKNLEDHIRHIHEMTKFILDCRFECSIDEAINRRRHD